MTPDGFMTRAELLARLKRAAKAARAYPSFATGLVPMCRLADDPPCASDCLEGAHFGAKPCAPTIARFAQDLQKDGQK